MPQQTHCSLCRSCLLLAGVLILGGCAGAGRPTPAAGSTKDPAGYLAAAQLPQATAVLPSAPQAVAGADQCQWSPSRA